MPAHPHNPGPLTRLEVRHSREAIDSAVKAVLDGMVGYGYAEASVFAVRLALEEALANAFRHGHRGLPEDTAAVVEFRVEPSSLEMHVQDRGPGFNPAAVPDPTLDENLELPSGRGLMLMRAYMSSVAFNAAGNRVSMVYRRPQR
jgi:serine/threonine-protein kinase RsbW